MIKSCNLKLSFHKLKLQSFLNQKSACSQNNIIFGLDHKLIPGFDTLSNTVSTTTTYTSLALIALNPKVYLSVNKLKHKQSDSRNLNLASNNVMLLANSLKKSIAIFTQAFLT